jgi:hypothetical protein
MSFLDTIVDANFRSENAGRVVVFPSSRHHKGYLVKSPAEELGIRSFLKMFYFAYFAILFLGSVLSTRLSVDVYNASLDSYAHLLRALGICVGIYFVLVGLPFLLLWRSYKSALLGFVSAQDEVVLSGKRTSQQRLRLAFLCIAASAVLIMALGVLLLVRAK